VGVGGISNTYDNTSESFNLLAFLKTHPLQVGGPQIEFVLVDHPSDAEYVVSGKVTAAYDHKLRSTMDRRPSRGQDRMRDETPSSRAQKPHEFTYTHALDLTLWKGGRKLGTLQASSDGPHPGIPDDIVQGTVWADNYDGIRMTLLAPVWKELATRLERQLTSDLTTAGKE
jgi:hypothetical protein